MDFRCRMDIVYFVLDSDFPWWSSTNCVCHSWRNISNKYNLFLKCRLRKPIKLFEKCNFLYMWVVIKYIECCSFILIEINISKTYIWNRFSCHLKTIEDSIVATTLYFNKIEASRFLNSIHGFHTLQLTISKQT